MTGQSLLVVAAAAHRALCELEDVLDAYHAAGHVPDVYEASQLELVGSRWQYDTRRKIQRAGAIEELDE